MSEHTPIINAGYSPEDQAAFDRWYSQAHPAITVGSFPPTVGTAFMAGRNSLRAQLAEARRERDEWKNAIIDAAVVNWTLRKEHENDPKLAVNDLLAWESKVALDPAVSEDARKMIDAARAAGYAEAKADAQKIATSFGFADKSELLVIPGVDTSAMNAQQLTARAIAARIAKMKPA